jgi:hypothetical protein
MQCRIPISANVLAVSAVSGFFRMYVKKDVKPPVVPNAGRNVTVDNVNAGTGKTNPISKTSIWAKNWMDPLNRPLPNLRPRRRAPSLGKR